MNDATLDLERALQAIAPGLSELVALMDRLAGAGASTGEQYALAIDEVARRLAVGPKLVQKAIDRGELATSDLSMDGTRKRAQRVAWPDVLAWFERRRMTPKGKAAKPRPRQAPAAAPTKPPTGRRLSKMASFEDRVRVRPAA